MIWHGSHLSAYSDIQEWTKLTSLSMRKWYMEIWCEGFNNSYTMPHPPTHTHTHTHTPDWVSPYLSKKIYMVPGAWCILNRNYYNKNTMKIKTPYWWVSQMIRVYIFIINTFMSYQLIHTCDNLMMAMREIWCSDEGDQGLNEGDFSKLQKGVLKRLFKSLTPSFLWIIRYTMI